MSSFSTQPSTNCFIPALTSPDNSTKHSATVLSLSSHILSSITNMEPRGRASATNRISTGCSSTSSAPDSRTDSRTVSLDPTNDPKIFVLRGESGESCNSADSDFLFHPQFNVSQYSNSSTDMRLLTDRPQLSHDSDSSTPSSASSSSGSMQILFTPIYGESEPQIKENIMEVVPNFGLAMVGPPEEVGTSTYEHPEPDSGMWIAPCNRTTLPTSDMRSSMPSAALDNSEISWCAWYEPEYVQALQGFSETQFEYHKGCVSGQLASHQQHPRLYPSQDSIYTPFNSTSSSSTSILAESETNTTQSTIIPQLASSHPTSPEQSNPITVLQPRPRRCIPIISLSEIASAWGMSSKDYSSQSQEALSPLDLHCQEYTTAFSQSHPLSFADTSPIDSSRNSMPSGNVPTPMDTSTDLDPTLSFYSEQVPTGIVLCSCGCMESYVIPEERSTYLM